MKNILLISDTHGYLDPKLHAHIQAADEVWHAGDLGTEELANSIAAIKPFRAVYGNIDGAGIRITYPENLVFNCEGLKVLMTHIGGYPGKYPARVKDLIVQHQPGLFICGHSHILKVVPDKQFNLIHINPGACGVQGFHQVKTAIRFQIDKAKIFNAEVIELGKRNSLL